MTKFWAVTVKQGQGPGVLGCQILSLCSHFMRAESQQNILSGQHTWTFAFFEFIAKKQLPGHVFPEVSAQMHVDMLRCPWLCSGPDILVMMVRSC